MKSKRQHCICSKISLSRTGSRTKQNLDLNRVPLHLFSLSAFTSLSIASAETHRHCYQVVVSQPQSRSNTLLSSISAFPLYPWHRNVGPVVVEEELLGLVLQLFHLHLLWFEIAVPVLPLIHQVCRFEWFQKLLKSELVPLFVPLFVFKKSKIGSGDEGEEAWEISDKAGYPLSHIIELYASFWF
ncbi:hypothetical protein Cgig2_007764 [Carnegiea gigantea]|uniref:Uncharacterized protein n=1 Tax=Carnegiea gigantea TaxID=171969 RepID=A0A9Q1K8N6_9CARY|nr:hypothetical protein Cgig2_007764 [Carnegiea gigantea]